MVNNAKACTWTDKSVTTTTFILAAFGMNFNVYPPQSVLVVLLVTEFGCALSRNYQVVIQTSYIRKMRTRRRREFSHITTLFTLPPVTLPPTTREDHETGTISNTITLPRTVVDTMLLASDAASPEKCPVTIPRMDDQCSNVDGHTICTYDYRYTGCTWDDLKCSLGHGCICDAEKGTWWCMDVALMCDQIDSDLPRGPCVPDDIIELDSPIYPKSDPLMLPPDATVPQAVTDDDTLPSSNVRSVSPAATNNVIIVMPMADSVVNMTTVGLDLPWMIYNALLVTYVIVVRSTPGCVGMWITGGAISIRSTPTYLVENVSLTVGTRFK
jgi:hypothetical protein